MRISDWSSDVCSSDLLQLRVVAVHYHAIDVERCGHLVVALWHSGRHRNGEGVLEGPSSGLLGHRLFGLTYQPAIGFVQGDFFLDQRCCSGAAASDLDIRRQPGFATGLDAGRVECAGVANHGGLVGQLAAMCTAVIVINLIRRLDLLGVMVERYTGQRTNCRTNRRTRDTVTLADNPCPERGEIGRASCRERGCQYVTISVVAVKLKKKKT